MGKQRILIIFYLIFCLSIVPTFGIEPIPDTGVYRSSGEYFHTSLSNNKSKPIGLRRDSYIHKLRPFPIKGSLINATIINYSNSTYPVNIFLNPLFSLQYQNPIVPIEGFDSLSQTLISYRIDSGVIWNVTLRITTNNDENYHQGPFIFLRNIDGVDIPNVIPENTIVFLSSMMTNIYTPTTSYTVIIYVSIVILLIIMYSKREKIKNSLNKCDSK